MKRRHRAPNEVGMLIFYFLLAFFFFSPYPPPNFTLSAPWLPGAPVEHLAEPLLVPFIGG